MSALNRKAALAWIIAAGLSQTAAFAQMGNTQLTAEEQVAAQNFNGIDIVGDSLGTPVNSSVNTPSAQNFNGGFAQNSLSTSLNNQNTQLGSTSAFAGGASNSNSVNGMQQNTGLQSQNNGMISGFVQNNSSSGGLAGNGMSSGGDIVQSIGNTLMNDPKMMQRAVGVAGAAALFGLFVTNGGVGGMMRSAGMDNTRHIRGPGGGY